MPESCCNINGTEKERNEQFYACQKEADLKYASHYLRSNGCLTRILEAGRHMSLLILVSGFGVVVFEIFALSTAVCILHAAGKFSGLSDMDY